MEKINSTMTIERPTADKVDEADVKNPSFHLRYINTEQNICSHVQNQEREIAEHQRQRGKTKLDQ